MSRKKTYEIGLYQRVLAVGSTPFERLSTMYIGAIRLCKQGLKAAEADQIEQAKAKAERLIAVLRRLDLCLDFNIAPDLCKNLSQLYAHMQVSLSDEKTGHRAETFRESLRLLETLWDGFKQAQAQTES